MSKLTLVAMIVLTLAVWVLLHSRAYIVFRLW